MLKTHHLIKRLLFRYQERKIYRTYTIPNLEGKGACYQWYLAWYWY